MLLLLQYCAIAELDGDPCALPVKQQLGEATLLVAGRGVLELPFGAGHGGFLLGLREWNAETGPQHGHDDVGLVRRDDQVLEMVSGEQWLAFP